VLVPNTGLEGLISGTYQPVWDAWQRFIQPLVSNVSLLPASLLDPYLGTGYFEVCYLFGSSHHFFDTALSSARNKARVVVVLH